MRILIVTQYYNPENFIINDIVQNLKNDGYNIEILTAIPNYPNGTFFPGYNLFNKNKEIINTNSLMVMSGLMNTICSVMN